MLAVVLVASGCASNTSTSPEDRESPPENQTDDVGTDPSEGASNTTIVTYTSSGFQPNTVTVQQGDTVLWRSEASRPMWVASNRHPTHTQHDGSSRSQHCENGAPTSSSIFDQCSVGGSFTFTFDKKGDWNYHNHGNNVHQGTVIVE
jgi:plastocyanin